jgi:outer membrane receptor protein involved in Fe transport
MKSTYRLPLGALIAACSMSMPAYADDASPDGSPPATTNDIYAMDLASLLNMKVTTASKFSENLADAPGVMEVVTKDELRRFGGMTLGEILDRVPGLSMTTASFTDRSMVAARGDQTQINGGHILFLINGRPTREVLEGGIISDLLESFPVNILERIEVVLGPGSVLYGSNAFSAVVNLITQKAEGNALVVTGMGGASSAATSGQVMFQRGGLSIVGAGQFHQDPNWNTPVSTTYFGVVNADIPDRSKGAYLEADYKGLSIMSSYTDWTTSYLEGAVGLARWRRGFADLGYKWKAGSKWDMSLDLTYTRTTLDASNSIPFITRDSYEALLEWTNTVTLTDKDRLTFGSLFDYRRGEELFYYGPRPTPITDGSQSGGAFYAQIDHALRDNLKLIGGFQANKMDDIKLDVVPRGGVIWSLTPRWIWKALYSEAFRAPSLNETLLHYIPPPAVGGPSLLGNPNLAPEKDATADIGLSYQGAHFQTGVDYFHSRQTNIIVLGDVTAAGEYVNLGKATFQGVQFEEKYYFRKNFFLMGSVIYQANRDGSGNSDVTPVANFGGKAGISYESANGITVGFFDVHEGGLPGYGAALNPQPGAYDMLNANLRFDLAKLLHTNAAKGIALVAHAENLENRQVWLPDWQDVPGDSIFVNRGRTILAGVEFALKAER